MYITLIIRLYKLSSSSHRITNPISKRQLTIIVCLFIFDVTIIGLFLLCIYDTFSGENIFSHENNGKIGIELILFAITVFINDLIINIVILFMVLTQLYQIIFNLENQFQSLLKSNYGSYTKYDNYNNDEMERNRKEQMEIMTLITKLSLLTIISVFFAQFWNIAEVYTDYKVALHDSNVSLLTWTQFSLICFIFRAVEALINCIVLYLAFVFNENEYIVCCACCHQCLNTLCTKCVATMSIKHTMVHDRVYHDHGNSNVSPNTTLLEVKSNL